MGEAEAESWCRVGPLAYLAWTDGMSAMPKVRQRDEMEEEGAMRERGSQRGGQMCCAQLTAAFERPEAVFV